MTLHALNIARPSPDRIIEANRPRDWFDAHCDYAVTGDVVYRAERLAHEDRYQEMPSQTEGMGALGYLIAAIGTYAVLQWGIPLALAGIKIIGDVL